MPAGHHPLDPAIRQAAIDRIGHELNEAAARRRRLAVEVNNLRVGLAKVLADIQRHESEYRKLQRLRIRIHEDLEDKAKRLDRDFRLEEGIRARLERFKAGGSF
jgi:hypothetical protein